MMMRGSKSQAKCDEYETKVLLNSPSDDDSESGVDYETALDKDLDNLNTVIKEAFNLGFCFNLNMQSI